MPDSSALPVLALRDTVLFPGVATPITAGRLKTLRAVEAALREGAEVKRVFAVAQRDGADEPSPEGLYAVGVVSRIVQVQRFGSGLQLVLACERRATSIRYSEQDGVIRAAAIDLADLPPRAGEQERLTPLAAEVREQAIEYGRQKGAPEEVLKQFIGGIEDPVSLVHHVAFYLDLGTVEKQALLETLSIEQRLRLLAAHLQKQIGAARSNERARGAREDVTERQRELYLREQLRAIQRELGDDDDASAADRIAERIEQSGMPDDTLAEVRRDLRRLKRMGREGSPEAQQLLTWLEWVADLPWDKRTEDRLDLAAARDILEADHHGLADVKDRVLELLAVKKLLADKQSSADARARAVSRGPILLFLGPPGVGKTSISESIARALGREHVRISLGGARDEADIRGHRRTYVGAMAGRILAGIRRVGTKNPVITLDEIDKLGVSYQGDPAAALLEVLDPAQNRAFVDHYLGVPFDLSEALFICTANFREQIPAPLLDRMEIVPFAGYTEAEKLAIARRYLVPRQREQAGLDARELSIADAALTDVIARYTREAGVRQLERTIGRLARKAARKIVDGEIAVARFDAPEQVRALLGRAQVHPERRLDRDEAGVATGMYYTQTGGDIMHVEASVMPGKGELVLTGQLGEVMKESGRAALTYARTHAAELGIPLERLVGRDFHVHVPAGAIPKDGPSAGITMAVALVSALSLRPIRSDVAMTGEITLRGRVLPIGGVREKVLGAHRAGIAEVMLPRDNEPDLEDVAPEVRSAIRFHFVDSIDDAVELALRAAARADALAPAVRAA
ncbi:MAG TPA: endopeptidase La [Minicystis sp.]|nr:endopeptidase La [Minicystis sp.]